MDRAAVAGGVVAAVNAVPVKGSAIDGILLSRIPLSTFFSPY